MVLSQDSDLDLEAHADEDHALNPTSMPQERAEAIAQQQRPNALIIHETIRLEGVEELKRDVPSLLLSGFAAGLSMGFSLVCEGVLQSALPDEPWRHLITAFGYTIGFLIVVIGRQQLFTENTLTPILSLLHNRDLNTLWRVARLWTLVLAANIGATWVVSYALFKTDVFEPNIHAAFLEISHHSLASSFGTTFVRGIFAGWLIALMVWLLPAAEAARIFVVVIITYIVSLSNFAHIIAGSVDAAYVVYAGEASFADYVILLLRSDIARERAGRCSAGGHTQFRPGCPSHPQLTSLVGRPVSSVSVRCGQNRVSILRAADYKNVRHATTIVLRYTVNRRLTLRRQEFVVEENSGLKCRC